MHDDTAELGEPTPLSSRGPEAGGEGHVEVRITGGLFRPRFPRSGQHGHGDDELEQQLDPNAWSLNPEGRAREAATADVGPDVPVGPDTWFMEAGDLLAQAYCLTLVRGSDVDSTFLRLKAKPNSVGGPLDLEDLVGEAYEGVDDDRYQLAGAAQIGEWTLVLEPNGFAGTGTKHKRALSRGTTVITFYEGFSGSNELTVTTDGVEQLTFDRFNMSARTGNRIADFDADLLAAGFDLQEQDEEGDEGGDSVRDDVASAIVVERLAGVRLTLALLSGVAWRTALIEKP